MRHHHVRLWILLLLAPGVLLTFACRKKDDPASEIEASAATPVEPTAAATAKTQISLRDVAAQIGVTLIQPNGEEQNRYSILETLGSGIAWIDYDNDGFEDLMGAGGGTFGPANTILGNPNSLYKNLDGRRFESVHAPARFARSTAQGPLLYSHACLVADFNNDGFDDVFQTGYGRPKLWQNCGDGTFLSLDDAGALLNNADWSASGAWGDFNGDGNLDLYIVCYVDWSFDNDPTCRLGERTVCSPVMFEGLPDRLCLSDGAGAFQMAETPELPPGKGLGVLSADLDLDGDCDLYVANDTTPNFLFENQGDGSFQEVGIESGTAFGQSASSDGSMGLDAGDADGDGDLDLWVTNFEGQAFALYEQQTGGLLMYEHRSGRYGFAGVGATYVGFGTALLDLDHDGDLDVLSANGHVTPMSTNSPLQQLPLLFENVAARKFAGIQSAASTYLGSPHRGRGLAYADFDMDGDLDIAISHCNEPAAVLRNELDNTTDWLKIRLIGKLSTRTPVGATVRVMISQEQTLIRQLMSGNSYLSTHTNVLHFGLGELASKDELSVEINWPSGTRQQIKDVAANQTLMVIEE